MDNQPFRVLLIDDDAAAADRFGGILARARGDRFELVVERDVPAALLRLAETGAEAVVLDDSLADGAGLLNIRRVLEQAPSVPLLVLGQTDEEARALAAVHEGAEDYLVANLLTPQILGRSLRFASEQRRNEAALRAAEQKYHGIFEHIVEGIFQTTEDGRYLSANPALARIYGYASPAELIAELTDIGRKLYVAPARRAQFVEIMAEHDTVTDFESEIYRKDGSIIWIAENVRAIRDAAGRLRCYEGTVEDITQRKKAEQDLRDSEALYHSLVETLPQNIFRKDLEKRFTFVNQRFCKTLNRTAAEILGRTDFDFFPAELAEKYRRDDDEIMRSGKPLEAQEIHQSPGGEKQFVQTVKTPLYDAQKRVIGLQAIFWDITARKRAEEQARLATAELARSQEALRKKNAEMEADLKMAGDIQQQMLPQTYPAFPPAATPAQSRLRFSHRFLPTGTVGGDYFNIQALSDSEAGLFICDVMGHGVRSALVAAMLRALVEELKPLGNDPGRFLSQLNHDLCAILQHTDSPLLTTAFYAVADVARGELRFANAGHPQPLLVHRPAGDVEFLHTSGARPQRALGLFGDTEYVTHRRPLAAGDLVVMFTDGLYEVDGPDDSLYTLEQFVEAVRRRAALPAAALFDAVLAEIQAFAEGRPFSDDVCMVGMEVAAVGPNPT